MTDEPTPVHRMTLPGEVSELAPEQRAALEQMAERIVTHVRVMIDAFDQFAAACVKAQQSMEQMRHDWDEHAGFVLVPDGDHTPTTTGDTTP
jgi:hypothetical protein